MQKNIPDFSPLVASELICTGCGDVLPYTIVRNSRGHVEHLLYKHTNADKGCSYTCEAKVYSNLQMLPLRPDGSAVSLR